VLCACLVCVRISCLTVCLAVRSSCCEECAGCDQLWPCCFDISTCAASAASPEYAWGVRTSYRTDEEPFQHAFVIRHLQTLHVKMSTVSCRHTVYSPSATHELAPRALLEPRSGNGLLRVGVVYIHLPNSDAGQLARGSSCVPHASEGCRVMGKEQRRAGAL
jgi:hypothetical protein